MRLVEASTDKFAIFILATPSTSQIVHPLLELLAWSPYGKREAHGIAKQVVDIVEVHWHGIIQHERHLFRSHWKSDGVSKGKVKKRSKNT